LHKGELWKGLLSLTRPGQLQCKERGPDPTGAPEFDKLVANDGARSREVQDRMKKIAIIAFLLAGCVAAGRAQESRQDVSISATALIEPFIGSQTDVQVHSSYGLGAVASYRFMLTPQSALQASYGIDYQNKMLFFTPSFQQHGIPIPVRIQDISVSYVRQFNYKKFNPFAEAGPGAFIFLPIRNAGLGDLDAKRQTTIGGVYGAGIAYEISPSFDVRAEYRGLVTKVPSFDLPENILETNKWFNIFVPSVGVAYHF
jgi:outer membrane immunogenic protein